MTKPIWIKEEKTIDPMNEHGHCEKVTKYRIDDPILRDFCPTFIFSKPQYICDSPLKLFDTLEECQHFCEAIARSRIMEEIEKLEGMIELLGF